MTDSDRSGPFDFVDDSDEFEVANPHGSALMPLFMVEEEAPAPGPGVTPEIHRLIQLLIERVNRFGELAADATLGPLDAPTFDARLWDRFFENVRQEVVQILRRIDRDAAADLAAIGYADHTHMELAAFKAGNIVRGALLAALIDGPARGSTTMNISVAAQATAVAVAQVHLAPIIELAESQGVPEDVVEDLRRLQVEVDEGAPRGQRFERFTRLLERLKPYADLGTQLAKLGGVILG